MRYNTTPAVSGSGKTDIRIMDEHSRKLSEDHLYLVRHIVLKNIGLNESIQGLGYDDLYQVGCEGLCHAAMTYDDSHNTPFTAAASSGTSPDYNTWMLLLAAITGLPVWSFWRTACRRRRTDFLMRKRLRCWRKRNKTIPESAGKGSRRCAFASWATPVGKSLDTME